MTGPPASTHTAAVRAASETLDAHVCEIIRHHFTSDTGTPYWLEFAQAASWDPLAEVRGFDDLLRFPHFDDDLLRDLPHAQMTPKAYEGRPFLVFETGGTTGMPKQRLSWEDHLRDYEAFSDTLDDAAFPKGSDWLMAGPTGPRRLRLCIEHLAHVRGGSCYFIDMDPRWVKKLIGAGKADEVKAYKAHVVDQAVAILEHREVSCLFTTPLLLEAIGERISVADAGITGVFCGGTTMTPQTVRFLIEEVLEGRVTFVPTYGNTLMGLACSTPLTADDRYSVTYYAPQPRAVLRVVDPDDTRRTVDTGEWGRVELTTLTHEFFMPRFLERDEAMRRPACALFPWDGVGDVRPFKGGDASVIEGVY